MCGFLNILKIIPLPLPHSPLVVPHILQVTKKFVPVDTRLDRVAFVGIIFC